MPLHIPHSRSIWKTIGDSWAHWAHLVYVIGWIAAAVAAGWMDAREARVLVAYVGLFIYVLVLMALFLYFVASYSRKARYAEAMKCIHSASGQTRDLATYLDGCLKGDLIYERAEVVNRLGAILDAVVSAFNIATAFSNRACIKVLGEDGEASYVQTFCRDSVSRVANKEKDAHEGRRHWVDRNTDFSLILRGGRSFFLSNNISQYPNYMNTSVPEDSPNGQSQYISTMVLPIRHVFAADHAESLKVNKVNLFAFLAIDANVREAYQERYDVEMAATVADALYVVFLLFDRLESRRGIVPREIARS